MKKGDPGLILEPGFFIFSTTGLKGRYSMRVFIADSDPLFRTLVRLLVRKDAAIVVCGADDGHSAYDKAKRFRPHLLIVADVYVS
jgi:hypothetical protein